MTTTAAGDAAVARLNKATEAFEKIITGASNQVVDVPGYGNQPTLAGRVDQRLDETTATAAAEADRSRDEADRSTTQATAAANSVTQATAEYNKAKTQADRAQSEADRAAQITGLETVSDAVALAALPLPDVWAPLSDSLRLITGYGRDVLVGSDVVARMVNFSRSSTATYIGKDGLLKTAAVNEPRFEKEGLLVEGQSTNLFRLSDAIVAPSAAAVATTVVTDEGIASFTSVINKTKVIRAVQTTNAPGNTIILQTRVFSAGKTYTVSCWYRTDAGATMQFRFQPSGFSPEPFTVTGDKWARMSITFTLPVDYASAGDLLVSINQGAYLNIPLYFTGLQVEELPFASSYIPTAGAAVTRDHDVVTIPWALNVRPSNLTVALNYDVLGIGLTNQRLIEYAAPTIPRYLMQVTQVGDFETYCATQALKVVGPSIGPGSLAVASTSPTRHALKLTGKAIAVATPAGPVGATSDIRIGSGQAGASPTYGHIRNLRIWHSTLTDDQLKAVA